LLILIDERLDSLRQKRDNTDEAYDAMAAYEDLKQRIEVFLAAKTKETSVVATTISFATGISNWWSKRHVQICDKALDMGLFGTGVTICLLGGTGGFLAGAIPGAMVGGKPVVEVIKAYGKQRGHSKPE
jgi:hypothetical protein